MSHRKIIIPEFNILVFHFGLCIQLCLEGLGTQVYLITYQKILCVLTKKKKNLQIFLHDRHQ